MKSYWVVMEYPVPDGKIDTDAVNGILRQYGKLGRETGALNFTVYTDQAALEQAWQEAKEA